MITATSQPDYDDWGWDQYWSCADWIEWHKALSKANGLQVANQIFVTAFHQASFGAASYDCRTFSPSFRTYARENGFLEALYQGIGEIMQPVGPVIEAGGNIVDTMVSSTEILKKVIPFVIILVVIILLVYLSRKAQIL